MEEKLIESKIKSSISSIVDLLKVLDLPFKGKDKKLNTTNYKLLMRPIVSLLNLILFFIIEFGAVYRANVLVDMIIRRIMILC